MERAQLELDEMERRTRTQNDLVALLEAQLHDAQARATRAEERADRAEQQRAQEVAEANARADRLEQEANARADRAKDKELSAMKELTKVQLAAKEQESKIQLDIMEREVQDKRKQIAFKDAQVKALRVTIASSKTDDDLDKVNSLSRRHFSYGDPDVILKFLKSRDRKYSSEKERD